MYSIGVEATAEQFVKLDVVARGIGLESQPEIGAEAEKGGR